MRKLTMPELERMTIEEFKSAEKLPIVVVLDNLRSQNNIGSVFRTADAFRIQGVFLCGITSAPPHREIHKTALGATDSVDWFYRPTTLAAVKELQASGYTILAVEQTHESIYLNDYQPVIGNNLAIVFGNEVNGIDEEILPYMQHCIEIPQYGTKHSINVSVAVGIVIWDLFGKIKNFQIM